MSETEPATTEQPATSMERPPRLLIAATISLTVRSFLLPFARHFRSLGWQVDAAAEAMNECAISASEFDRRWDIPWSRRPWDPNHFREAPRRIRELVMRENYDLVHVHTPVAAFLTRLALRTLRRRGRPAVIYTAHGFHFYRGGPRVKGGIYKCFERVAGPWTDHLITINQEDFQTARELRLLPADHIHYMPGIGVDTSQLSPETVSPEDIQRVREEIGLAPEEHLLVMIAGFDPGKRHRDVLAALSRLKRDDVHLVLLGIGPLMEAIRQQAARLGLEQRVHFLGFRDDVPVWIRAARATVLPSEREGLPRSVMESMSLGTPVIGTDIRGLGDLLRDGCGLLFPVGDDGKLAEYLSLAVSRPEELQPIMAAARERIHDYDVHKIIRLHEDLYRKILATQRSACTPT